MKHFIDPLVDAVFKKLFGTEENKPLLIHFLNAVLKPLSPIISVVILNPYNEREFEEDKMTIVDVKARDQDGAVYQIEIQLAITTYLKERILYTWSRLYQSQMESGDDFQFLNPVTAIWIFRESLFKEPNTFHHHFQLHDLETKQLLSNHCSIHTLELNKWNPKSDQTLFKEDEKWYTFLKSAKDWKELPSYLDTPIMRQAMEVLEQFSEKQADYLRYQERKDVIRLKNTIEREMRETKEALAAERAEKEAERAEKEAERAEKEAERAEKEQLRKMLLEAGIDPNKIKD